MNNYSWTQPCCTACWFEKYDYKMPVRVKDPDLETCVYCGNPTFSGIFIRIDPEEAPFPTSEKGE